MQLSPVVLIDPRALESDLDRTLAVLQRAKAADPTVWLSAADISKTLREDHGLAVHWRTIQTALLATDGLAARKKRTKRWHFTIMKPGEDRLTAAQPILFVQPEAAVAATISLHQFFEARRGIVRVCDPYLDMATIEHLDACPTG